MTEDEYVKLCESLSDAWDSDMRAAAGVRVRAFQASLSDEQRASIRQKKLSYWTPSRRAKQAEYSRNNVEGHKKAGETLRNFWKNLSEEERASRMEHLLFSGEDTSSKEEAEVFEFVRSVLPEGVDIIRGDRELLEGLELDIYIPSKQLAIEYNGVYWHSDLQKDRNCHYEKYGFCRRKGVRLVQIWSCDWVSKRKQVEGLLRSALGASSRIGARKCTAEVILPSEKNAFLSEHHLQGADKSFLHVGLHNDGNIVSVMTFRKSRDNKSVELSRYCGEVAGGFSKLLNFAKPLLRDMGISEVVSYSDNMVFSGDVYEKNGWKLLGRIPIDYRVYYRGVLYHKSAWTKSSIARRFPQFAGSNLTEWEMEDAVGAYRVWDCGKKKWILYI